MHLLYHLQQSKVSLKKRGIPENLEVYVNGCVRYQGNVYAPIEELICLLKKVPKLNAGDLAKILENRQAPTSNSLPVVRESYRSKIRKFLWALGID